MRLDRSELSKAVQTALSLGAVAAMGITGTALAQNATTTQNNQKKPQTLQTIVVTGSHIRRVDLETSNPVVAITSQQIQATGDLTLGDVIKNMPVISGGIQTTTINNGGGTGQTLVGLRGLGPSRTLVLLDGERVMGFGGLADLNSIPANAVERIEVLTDGASAVYGSDAIGGVINIILKTNYQGAQFTANYGISDRGDAGRQGVSFMFGQTSDKGSILAGVDYNKFDQLEQSQRDFSKNAVSLSANSTYGSKGAAPAGLTYLAVPGSGVHTRIGGSSYAYRNRIFATGATLPPNLASCGSLSLNPGTLSSGADPTLADYHCYGSGDSYNYASVNLLMTPQERTNAFFKGVYHLTDNIDFYATVFHNVTSSHAQLAPAVLGAGPIFGTGFQISAANYYNPFHVGFGYPTVNAGAIWTGRMVPGGNRIFGGKLEVDQIMTGFRGNFDIGSRNWQWEVGYNYGHASNFATTRGLPDQDALNKGAGPSFLNSDNVVQCGTAPNGSAPDAPGAIPLANCTPFDPFNLNSPSAIAAIQAASAPAVNDTWQINREYHVGANGGVIDLPAGTVQLAVGADYRKLYTSNVVANDLLIHAPSYTCNLGSSCSSHLQGGYNVKEAYAEVYIPILKDMPFVHALSVDIGDRYSKYSNFGSTNNWKIGVQFRPISDLLLRGTVSSVFRAPTIKNIFGAPVSSAPLLSSDPCDGITVSNPACEFVPTDGTFKDTFVASHQQITAINTGSQFAGINLGPESGKSFDFGAVYSPHFVPGLTVSADIWRIYLNNTITTVGAQTVLDLCFAGVATYCPLIQRSSVAPLGQINIIIQPTNNLGRMDYKGLDLAAFYKLPQFSFGQFDVGVHATYMSQVKIQTAPGNADANVALSGVGMMGQVGSLLAASCPFPAGGMCFFPRIRAQGHLRWQLGPWDAQWTMRYSSPFKMGSYDPSQGSTALSSFTPAGPNLTGPLVYHYGSWVYSDVTFGYNIEPLNTRIDIGVNNVFDKQPPVLYANNTLNADTDPEDFDVLGRYYWARLSVKF